MSSGHAVVDGSNIATEGRNEPSLAQLEEALAAFRDEYDFAHVTVIVDASFEHRVSQAERARARTEIDSGKIITPPAGVVGRGDTFILQVAHRANAVVLSNDSFQEFHGTYSWLFDEGRLIGGKPVPAVGWIYVPRVPVRGPVSRRATKASSTTPKVAAKKAATKKAPPGKPKADKAPAKRAPAKKAPAKSAPAKSAPAKSPPAKTASTRKSTRKSASPTTPGANADRKWQAFRRAHPEGSSITATVERFSSHGAYADSGGVEVYLPLRLLSDPPPRRARDVVAIGESGSFVVHRFDSARRGIDIGLLPFDGAVPADPPEQRAAATKKAARRAPAKKSSKRATAKKAPAKKTPAKKTTKKVAKKAPAKKAAKKTGARKTGANEAPAKKVAETRPAKKASAKNATGKKSARNAGRKRR